MQNENYEVQELEARFEMESVVPTDGTVDPNGWYCRCGYEE